MPIKRDRYLQKLIDSKWNGMVKIITGVRRCGKSYLLFRLFKTHLLSEGVKSEHIIEIALDSLENKPLRDVNALYDRIVGSIDDGEKYYVFLDEIQLADDFESLLNSLLHKENLDLYVTGSNSKMLSSDIITEFRGRGDEIRMWPLSFSEFLPSFNGTEEEAWDKYTEYGGLPEITAIGTDEKKASYLQNLIKKTYKKDITDRYAISFPSALDNIFNVLSSSVGSLTNPIRLRDTMIAKGYKAIDDETVSAYVGYLENAFLFERSQRYDVKGRSYFDTPSKYYAVDIGLRNAKLNFRQNEMAHIMENIIYNELRSRGYSVDIGVVKYTKTEDGGRKEKTAEIDFVANRGSRRYYIQSAYNMDDPEKKETEIRPFLKINDSFKKIVVVGGLLSPRRDENGIVTMGIRNFLKDENSLEF